MHVQKRNTQKMMSMHIIMHNVMVPCSMSVDVTGQMAGRHGERLARRDAPAGMVMHIQACTDNGARCSMDHK